jgi:hypothetical protein
MPNYLSLKNNSLESRLIILCSQTSLNPENIEHISEILSRSLDWDFIKNIASRNGVLPLVVWNLINNFAQFLSPENYKEISQYLHNHTQKNLHSTFKLIEIAQILEKNRIAILPFKGTTLAKRAYNNLALRQYVDLDILVKPKDFEKTVEILLANNFELISNTFEFKRKPLFLRHKKDIGLINSEDNIRIELHWKLSGSHFALPLEIDELWNRLETINLGGKEINVLPFYDLFVYLCLHGSRHKWEKFSWICDLHELILIKENGSEKFNWEAVHRHAKKYGCEKVVELGLFLVQYFYELKIDYPGFEHIKFDATFLKIAHQIQKKAFSRDVNSSKIGDWYLYHLTLKERKTDRLRLHIYYLIWIFKLTFKPNALDEQVFHLPTIFYPLYYILRPFRLLFNYINFNSKKKPHLN